MTKDNNKAYWDALIRGFAWPNQKKSSPVGWYVLAGVVASLFLIGFL